jgi:peptidyl-prolyl cis-trans isomerase A (cyclophilin A)
MSGCIGYAGRRWVQVALVSALAHALLPAMAQTPAQQSSVTPSTARPQVRLATSMGDVVLELYPDKAPKTVENFLQYVRDKHYDGTVFHRVIDNFMVQGGGFDAKYKEKSTRAPVAHEGQAAIEKGGPKNVVGTVSMARTNDPQSATAQFFINVKDNAFLDPTPIPAGDPVARFEYGGRVYENIPRAQLLAAGQLYGYTVFGKVIAGMDVVNKIKATPTGSGGPFPTDVPKTPVTILKATLEK